MRNNRLPAKREERMRCWKVFRCREVECPAYKTAEPYCWLVSGTHCRDQNHGELPCKILGCVHCKVYQTNMDSTSRRETDNMFTQQIDEFSRCSSRREEELQNISMELAISLSEVMEALKKVSSGDPSVRVSEESDIELISQLKNMMNRTAEDLENIFNQFLNFTMDFAVYFEVLQRVTRGDLNARISGRLHSELSQSLQAVTNEMIESISREITGHERAEQALKESEKKYIDLYQNAPDGYCSLSSDGTILEVNNTWLGMLGYENNESIGSIKFQDLLTDEGRDVFRKTFMQLQKEGVTNNVEYHLKKKDGSLLPVVINDSAIFDDQGVFLKSRSIVRDASVRYAYRQKLEQANNDWRITFDSMPYGVVLLDRDFSIKRVNKQFATLYRCSFGDLVGRQCTEVIQSDTLRKIHHALISQNVISMDAFEFHNTDTRAFYLLSLTPIPNADGLTNSFVLSMVDITEMKTKERELDVSYKKLNELFEGLIHSFVNAIDAKSPWTKGHSERVTNYSLAIAEEMGLESEMCEVLRISSLLHDIGKIGTYDEILDKPTGLTREEFNLINMHPVRGVQILKPICQLAHLLPVIRHHHERIDGRGYPDGLKGDAIPLLSRVICVADSFDSMTSDRPYRAALGKGHAIEELKRHSGTQFDTVIVEAFFKTAYCMVDVQETVKR